ncbi:MAG: DEAD/DEAH box helicase [Bacteroidaceae bacterium]|nr:DEAD/DEAH box helicase [Bacteroidaceae bacterium]
MDFYDLPLCDGVLDALDDMNFTDTTPIQEHSIPPILEGRDLMGIAQTGTGKTAAYLLPVLSMLSEGNYPKDAINCVIMSPTRELAQQIDQAMQGFAYYLDGISSVAVYGGNDGIRYEQEKRGFDTGASIIIATPGRLISHLALGNIDLSRISFFILDEADRMLDMGFADDIMQIAKYLPTERQTIMFSATMPEKIGELAKTILRNPVEVTLALSRPADGIHQSTYICYEGQKLGIIKSIFQQREPRRVIIFAGSKLKVKDLSISLHREGFNVGAMHSDLQQSERDDVMFRFKSQKINILVATDIVARGIDIDDIQIVINYDVPHDAEDYVHRIGRTARAGAEGAAITLVSQKDQPYWRTIEHFLGYSITREPIPAELGDTPEYKKDSKPHKGGKFNSHTKGHKPSGKKPNKPRPNNGKPRGKQHNNKQQ